MPPPPPRPPSIPSMPSSQWPSTPPPVDLSWCTEPDDFTVYQSYIELPSHDSEELLEFDNACDAPNLQRVHNSSPEVGDLMSPAQNAAQSRQLENPLLRGVRRGQNGTSSRGLSGNGGVAVDTSGGGNRRSGIDETLQPSRRLDNPLIGRGRRGRVVPAAPD